jgi:ATP-binding protein involved in chromosome partitioning
LTELPTLNRLERRDLDIHLTWSDGTEHEITYDDLRHACPCAKCAPQRNEDETSMILRRNVEKLPREKPNVRKIGNYALSFEWNNGCSSGIHRFERLWKLGSKQDPDDGKPYVHGAW